jgi:hypothetical protein
MPTSLDRSASALLDEAANIIRSRGWTQGIAVDPRTKKVDILGAVSIAAGCRESKIFEDGFPLLTAPLTNRVAALRAWEVLDSHLMEDPLTWNDREGRSSEEVLRLLRNLSMDLALKSDNGCA